MAGVPSPRLRASWPHQDQAHCTLGAAEPGLVSGSEAAELSLSFGRPANDASHAERQSGSAALTSAAWSEAATHMSISRDTVANTRQPVGSMAHGFAAAGARSHEEAPADTVTGQRLQALAGQVNF